MDGYSDAEEIAAGSDPFNASSTPANVPQPLTAGGLGVEVYSDETNRGLSLHASGGTGTRAFSVTTWPGGGTFTPAADFLETGSFTFTPTAPPGTTIPFNYTVTAGTESANGTLSILIVDRSDPPPPPPPPPTEPSISTFTIMDAFSDTTGPTRKLIGVGEEVTCTLNGAMAGIPVAWAIDPAPGTAHCSIQARAEDPTEAVFKAGDEFAEATITAYCTGVDGLPKTASVTFTIIEPMFETADVAGIHEFAPGMPGVGLIFKTILHPRNVSFYNLQIKEVPSPAVGFTGNIKAGTELDPMDPSYLDPAGYAHDGEAINTEWSGIEWDNGASDTASFHGYLAGAPTGSWTWDIPVKWRVMRNQAEFIPVEHSLQNRIQLNEIVDGLGTGRVSKFGHSHSRTP
jgi:hypothetical protein